MRGFGRISDEKSENDDRTVRNRTTEPENAYLYIRRKHKPQLTYLTRIIAQDNSHDYHG